MSQFPAHSAPEPASPSRPHPSPLHTASAGAPSPGPAPCASDGPDLTPRSPVASLAPAAPWSPGSSYPLPAPAQPDRTGALPDGVPVGVTGGDTPPGCAVPHFPPVRVKDGRYRLRRLMGHRRRALAAGLAVTAAALVATGGPVDTSRARARPEPPGPAAAPRPESPPPKPVTALVRIADAAAVRLLHPGDRVDVVAAGPVGAVGGDRGAPPRVVAAGARVVRVPETEDGLAVEGALVLLSVPRPTAARLAGAGTTSRLAVTLC